MCVCQEGYFRSIVKIAISKDASPVFKYNYNCWEKVACCEILCLSGLLMLRTCALLKKTLLLQTSACLTQRLINWLQRGNRDAYHMCDYKINHDLI